MVSLGDLDLEEFMFSTSSAEYPKSIAPGHAPEGRATNRCHREPGRRRDEDSEVTPMTSGSPRRPLAARAASSR